MHNRHTLRQHFRDRRNQLTQAEQALASEELLKQCLNDKRFVNASRLAFYLASDGELDPRSIIEYCWHNKKEVYLPVLHPFTAGYLLFIRYTPDSQMVVNRYGIAEPKLECNAICPVPDLDIIFTPLVAFDADGNRLGMGGGFYDRTLAPIHQQQLNVDVMGLAHDCQQADGLPIQHWDIPLSTILTPKQVFSQR